MNKEEKKKKVIILLGIWGVCMLVCVVIGMSRSTKAIVKRETGKSVIAQTETVDAKPEEAPTLDLSALQSELKAYLKENDIGSKDVGYYVEDLESRQSIENNGDELYFAASTYKIPLAMVWYDAINAGDVEESEYRDLLENMIVYSDNDAAEYLFESLGGWGEFKDAITAYDKKQKADSDYLVLDNTFTPANMGHIVTYLYDHQEEYDHLIKDMKKSMPGQFLDRNLNIYFAQKYGSYEEAYNAAGVSLTGHPYVVTIYTDLGDYGESVIGDLNEICYDFFNTAE
ncbi:serine hydrolase [uncultured Dubosiella sp.]|uniref:serine hydrolase n=1 Tax=uncultured Dubosiella sp. TaxID=1937011 RepID=UPI0025B524F0|nr:serine hydrolase [uncultured Dubosiella sp.]